MQVPLMNLPDALMEENRYETRPCSTVDCPVTAAGCYPGLVPAIAPPPEAEAAVYIICGLTAQSLEP